MMRLVNWTRKAITGVVIGIVTTEAIILAALGCFILGYITGTGERVY